MLKYLKNIKILKIFWVSGFFLVMRMEIFGYLDMVLSMGMLIFGYLGLGLV